MRPPPDGYYHAAPLQYAPFVLREGALYSLSEIRRRGLPLRPRPAASRRDRKLQRENWVHLSLTPSTPLLTDRMQRGCPHILIAFSADLATAPGVAFRRYNTKAWRHQEDFLPVTDPEEKQAVLQTWQSGGYPSAELLVPEHLPLRRSGRAIYLASEPEQDWLRALFQISHPGESPPLPLLVAPQFFPEGFSFDWQPYWVYRDACIAAGVLLPPPDLAFA